MLALKHQLTKPLSLVCYQPQNSLYGGGTPSLLGQDAVDLAQHASAIVNPAEFSIEGNQTHCLMISASLTAGGIKNFFWEFKALTIMNLRSWAEFTRPTWLYDILAAKRA